MTTYTPSFSHQTDPDRERGYFPHVRSDAVIEEDIWNRILRDPNLGPKYQENVLAVVEEGTVFLRGHVTKQWHIALLNDIAGRVKGVVGVERSLTADPLLRERIVQALVENEITAPYVLTVRCHFGWVTMNGLVPSAEIAHSAEAVAGFVPGVRGILAIPTVFGSVMDGDGTTAAVRRSLQPRITAVVSQDGEDGKPHEAGWVSQVIIDPCSRLVSAVAVARMDRDRKAADRSPRISERLVPISAVEAANDQQMWLKAEECVESYPEYERGKFLTPPANWQPPFPYKPGEVRWAAV